MTQIVNVSQELITQDQLVGELRSIISGMTTEIISSLKRAAIIVKRLDESGYDYAGLPMSFIRMARAVSQQRLLPELVQLQGTALFNYGQSLPLPSQQTVIDDDSVSVIDLTNPSPENTKRLRFSQLSRKEMAIVFSEDGIRNPEQQFARLRVLQTSKLPEASPTIEDWQVDRKRGEIVIAGKRYSRKQLLRMIESLEK